MNKTLTAAICGAALSISSSLAFALDAESDAVTVTIDESSLPGNGPVPQYQADQLSGIYDEIFEVTGITGPNSGTFFTLASFQAGSWFNDGNPVIGSALNGFRGYNLYALFEASGTFTDSNGLANAGGELTFQGNAGVIKLFADIDQDTTSDVFDDSSDDIDSVFQTGATDDIELGVASLLSFGEGSVNSGDVAANGNFELIFSDWTLSPEGEAYFVAPRPFPLVLDINGNFQSFEISDVESVGIIENSSANAFFANPIPVPASLGLLGLGLVALGSVRKRKS